MRQRTAKSKAKIELGGRKIPLLGVSGKSPIDPAEFIPVLSPGARGADKVRMVRKVDLLPKSAVNASVAAYVNFGDTLLDIFSPTYGSYYPLGQPAFAFREAQMYLVHERGWLMAFAPGDQGEQFLQFGFGTKGNYLKVDLGETVNGGIGAILTVQVDGSQFNLDLTTRSNLSFDLFLFPSSPSVHEVRFSLSSVTNNLAGVLCMVSRVELYNSIRVSQDPPVFG